MGVMMLLLTLFGIALASALVLLPFATFGMKPLLRELIAETKRTNALLEAASRRAPVGSPPEREAGD